ncbi:MAG: imidazole glycerol phosphate synthase subunit HisH [Alphaproteobacteria bacterium]|nr:imidazole glycerol phosphate synthase subunit HisH [Alphaproteobacteria bacterium]
MSQAAPSIVIIDYGSGNLRSAEKAFARAAAQTAKPRDVLVSGEPEHLRHAEHIILPGVGAFGDCADGLRAIDGMVEALNERVIKDGKPFLGICVGMQLMCQSGVERAAEGRPHQGLGWFDAEVRAINVPAPLKVPHMGWNEISVAHTHKVIAPLHGQDVYFVHGFAAQVLSDDGAQDIAAVTDYGGPVTAILARDNYIGVQFHPEKSQAVGLSFIQRFLEWRA